MADVRLRVRSRRDGRRETNEFQLTHSTTRGRTLVGNAQEALDALVADEDASEARLYLSGLFVAGLRRDGTVWRP